MTELARIFTIRAEEMVLEDARRRFYWEKLLDPSSKVIAAWFDCFTRNHKICPFLDRGTAL